MSKINLENASFKDFENIAEMDPYGWAKEFQDYVDNWKSRGHWNYRQEALSAPGPEVLLQVPGKDVSSYVSLVSNDYLGFSQHHQVKIAAMEGITRYGTGSGASPAIGGHYAFHREIEEKIAGFFRRESAMMYTTGYTANSATFQALLKEGDLAILDMGVHASVYEGCQMTRVRTFLHNNMDALERILKESQGKYRTRMVIIDGVYSQEADIAHLDQIVALCKHYGAYLAMDDAHGIGVIGQTGRGVIELHHAWKDVDIITGTFSKTFGHLGGYVVASPELIHFLKFQARQHIFSVTATPASACILKSIDLIDEEPWWQQRLWDNINYLKAGLHAMGLNTLGSASAIVPVKTGNPTLNAEACRLLMEAGIYANQIGYPAVPRKNARIRMSIMATHTREHMDKVLNAWEWVGQKLELPRS